MSKSIYTHKHHIIPRHAGGSDDPSNIVELTTEEHALAHKKLFFIYGRWQDELAYLGLSGQIGKEEITRLSIQKAQRSRIRTFSIETRKRMSIGSTGILHTEETKRKISEANKGKKFTEEHKRKLSETKKEYWKNKRNEKIKG